MHFAAERQPSGFPRPPSVDEVAAAFEGPLFAFAPQSNLEEAAASTMSSGGSTGRMSIDAVSLSYTLWRHPQHRVDPVWPLPDWANELRARLRYPLLWEAVRTTRLGVDVPTLSTAEAVLIEHTNYVLMNVFRDTRVTGEFPGELVDGLTAAHVEGGSSLILDGAPVPAVAISGDRDIFAIAARLHDHVLSAVIAREDLPFVTVEFATRTARAG